MTNSPFFLGIWTVKQSSIPYRDFGHGERGVFHSAEWHDGDWSKMESGRRGYGASSKRKSLEFFGLVENLKAAL
ncbi:hypothetical protein TNCV_112781 [Trichonephila clavipes]|nr:hypothetical protein TNCV_112781 [Trichonephila clavipes]